MIGQLLVQSTQALLVVGQDSVEDPPARPGSGPRPSARSLPTPGTDEDLAVPDIHLSCRLSVKSIRGQPVDRPAPAPTPAKDVTRGGSFPLSAVTSARLPQATFTPRIIYGQGQDTRAHSN